MRRLVLVVFALSMWSCTAAPPVAAAPASATIDPYLSVASGSPRPSLVAMPWSVQADFDCDGRPDRLDFFGRDTGAPLATVLARLTLASGTASEVSLGIDDGFSPVIGVTDVNGDTCDDAIVSVGHGASTVWTGFLVYDGALRRVEENGEPAMFLFAGSVRHGNSIECRRTKDTPELVARGVSDYTSDYAWDLVEDVHHWYSRSGLVLWSTTRTVILVSVAFAMPPNQDRYWGLSCGTVKFPG
ncbi:MAG: hypothetical protein E6J13_05995 [Chloroflexi bacterium]|nr:MAG: hypothetical protein E6J13_05995 [Chloroflexota bacterium]